MIFFFAHNIHQAGAPPPGHGGHGGHGGHLSWPPLKTAKPKLPVSADAARMLGAGARVGGLGVGGWGLGESTKNPG